MDNGQYERGPSASDAYGAKWSSHVESPSRRRIRREIYGDEYPTEVDPRSFLTWTELRRVARLQIELTRDGARPSDGFRRERQASELLPVRALRSWWMPTV